MPGIKGKVRVRAGAGHDGGVVAKDAYFVLHTRGTATLHTRPHQVASTAINSHHSHFEIYTHIHSDEVDAEMNAHTHTHTHTNHVQ